ncbi:MAG: energy-coupling factor transporter transmembrane component T [Thermomicrobiales bacterium]
MSVVGAGRSRKVRRGFVEKTLAGLAGAFERSLYGEGGGGAAGVLQGLDPRVKVVGLLLLIIAAAAARSLVVIAAILLGGSGWRCCRGCRCGRWRGGCGWGRSCSRGRLRCRAGADAGAGDRRGAGGGVVDHGAGVRSALFLLGRVLTSTTLATLLILTTPWAHVLKALRVLRVPVIFVVILGMTYRYIFLMLQTAQDMFESRRSRMVGELPGEEQRRVAAASVGVLLSKSFQLSNDVYLAMQSRGFRGEVHTLDDFAMTGRDWLACAGFVIAAGVGLWLGR